MYICSGFCARAILDKNAWRWGHAGPWPSCARDPESARGLWIRVGSTLYVITDRGSKRVTVRHKYTIDTNMCQTQAYNRHRYVTHTSYDRHRYVSRERLTPFLRRPPCHPGLSCSPPYLSTYPAISCLDILSDPNCAINIGVHQAFPHWTRPVGCEHDGADYSLVITIHTSLVSSPTARPGNTPLMFSNLPFPSVMFW